MNLIEAQQFLTGDTSVRLECRLKSGIRYFIQHVRSYAIILENQPRIINIEKE